MTNHLTNLISKAAHDLDYCITQDLAHAIANDDEIGDWAALPLHTDDLAALMILNYATYSSFEEAAMDYLHDQLEAADEALLRYAR